MSTVLSSLSCWLRGLRTKPSVERRLSPRTEFTEPVAVRTAAGTTFRGIGRDLSESGLGAIVYADLEIGDSVIIYFSRHHQAASQFVCRPACVRRRFGNHYGFEFRALSS